MDLNSDAIAETRDLRFLSNAAAARQPVQQPKSRSAYAARGRYAVLGFIYYEWGATLDLVKIEILESRGYFGGGPLWMDPH